MKPTLLFILLALAWIVCEGQDDKHPAKVWHAEPIFFDLIRDLGALKGEREWNVGMGMAKEGTSTDYSYLIEYEFAPVNRLGLELEVPLLFRTRTDERNGIEGIKAALQYSFFVSERHRATVAAGYLFEGRIPHGHFHYSHTPFFIVAKRWGEQFHSMLYAGPQYDKASTEREVSVVINISAHYVIPGTRNFVGVEINDRMQNSTNVAVIRPQVKLKVSAASALGVALGIPSHAEKPLDFLIRWIYEPGKKK